MNAICRFVLVPWLVGAALFLLNPARSSAELLPPGDFNGTSFEDWGLNYVQWAIASGLGGQSIPNTVNGARYLPPNFGGGNFFADVTIPEGTALVGAPFFLFGEEYDMGAPDNPNDPIIDLIFADAMIQTTFNGAVVLSGTGTQLMDRRFGVGIFPAPIPYAVPQPRGDRNAIAAIFGTGTGTIFANLPLGQHTIVNSFDSPNFFGAASFTYNVTVVPETASGLLTAGGLMALAAWRRRLRRHGMTG